MGLTFTLYFPLYRGEALIAEAVNSMEEGQGETIVVVDDDPRHRHLAHTALERVGYKVVVLESGEGAVCYLKDHSAEVVILDMVMEGIGGVEALRQIREYNPSQAATILTGNPTSERAQAAIDFGNCDVLAKPIQVSTLTRVIHAVLARATVLPSATQ